MSGSSRATDAPGVTGTAGPDARATGGATARLLGSTGAMAAGTVASRLLGFVRNVVILAAIGSRSVGDTYALANSVPNVLFTLMAGGVLNAVFVPQLVRAMKQGGDSGDGGASYADRLLTLSFVVLGAVTLVATLAAPLIVHAYGDRWSGADYALSIAFAYWCLPQIFFYGLYTMLGQVLNARGSFGPMMWTPILNNVVVIVTGFAFIATATIDAGSSGSVGAGEVALLGAGTTLGIAVQALALVPLLRRAGYRYRPRFDWRGVGLGRAGALAKWTVAFVAVNQLAYVVVVRLVTAAGHEAAATQQVGSGLIGYQNAYLVLLLPHSIFTVSLVTALLPRMSVAGVDGRLGDIRADISHGLRLAAVATVPAAVLFLVLGPELGVGLFSWGATSLDDGLAIGLVLAGFALGLVPFSAHHLVLRGFYAQEDTRTPFLLTCVVASCNVVLAVLASLLAPVAHRTVAIAAAYALSYVVGVSVSAAVLRRRLGGLDGHRVVRVHVRLLLAAALGAVPAWLLDHLLRAALPRTRPAIVLALAVGAVVLLATYLQAARRMRVTELTDVLASVRARVRR